jgi:acetyl-CoA carboxylase biotin carboxyl carrier protein
VARESSKPGGSKSKLAVDHDLIRDLSKLLDETGLSEIELEQEGMRVRVGRNAAVVAAPVVSSAPAVASTAIATPAAAAAVSDPTKHPGAVTSPMVGTAYLASAPGAKPFVDIGSKVKAGETLLIIEAMKTMNQIPAPRAGTVTQILVGDAQPVEFGEALMIIE